MDVRCGQCGTEYEFDDALLSSRGTMVRCTACSHQFRVFPAQSTGGVPDRWIVDKSTGRQLVFTSLKDLQKAIAAGIVQPRDVLTRGGETRAVGDIAELESLFRKRAGPAPAPRTLLGIAPAESAHASSPPQPRSEPADEPPRVAGVPSAFESATTTPIAARTKPPRVENSVLAAIRLEESEALETADIPPPARPARRTTPAQGVPEARALPVPTQKASPKTAVPEQEQTKPQPAAVPVKRAMAEPARVKPAPPEPTPPRPAATEPHRVKPAPPEPTPPRPAATAKPAAAGPTATEPAAVPTEPAAVRPAANAKPTSSEPVAAAPATTEPAPTRPAPLPPRPGEPAIPQPAAARPPPIEPDLAQSATVKAKPGSSGGDASGPLDKRAPEAEAAKPAAAKPAAAKPAAAKPAAAKPAAAKPSAANPTAKRRGADRSSRDRRDASTKAAPAQRPVARQVAPTRKPVSDRSVWIGTALGILALIAVALVLRARSVSSPSDGQGLQQRSTDEQTLGDAVERARKLIGESDLAAAKAQLDRARAIAPNDTRVLGEMGRWHTQRAELLWWRTLLVNADEARLRALQDALDEELSRARSASDLAIARGEATPAMLWVRPALARMAGDTQGAQRRTEQMVSSGLKSPAYLQGALGMAVGSADWATLAAQFGRAASTHRGLSPARVGLVVALVRLGQFDEARSELEVLSKQTGADELSKDLLAFWQREKKEASVESRAPAAETAPVAPGGSTPPVSLAQQLNAAGQAMQSGNLDRAEQLYNAVAAQQPDNTEALTGLADVARLRKDPETAQQLYKNVLKRNPNYLPALIAQADHQWQIGNRSEAVRLYQRVLQQASPSTTYGRRAVSRIRFAEAQNAPPKLTTPDLEARQDTGRVAPPPSPGATAAPQPTPGNKLSRPPVQEAKPPSERLEDFQP